MPDESIPADIEQAPAEVVETPLEEPIAEPVVEPIVEPSPVEAAPESAPEPEPSVEVEAPVETVPTSTIVVSMSWGTGGLPTYTAFRTQ